VKATAVVLAAVGVSVGVWVVPAHGDPWALIALAALRLLAAVVLVGAATLAVLDRPRAVEEERAAVLEGGPAVRGQPVRSAAEFTG
jgi:membrane protein YdbS with pleckstrin-like domain